MISVTHLIALSRGGEAGRSCTCEGCVLQTAMIDAIATFLDNRAEGGECLASTINLLFDVLADTAAAMALATVAEARDPAASFAKALGDLPALLAAAMLNTARQHNPGLVPPLN